MARRHRYRKTKRAAHRAPSLVAACVACFSWAGVAVAEPVLRDVNGDGSVEVLAFGDSITYGVGDGTQPGQYVPSITVVGPPRGYPLRLSSLVGVSVLNAGIPGEELVGRGKIESGVDRFPSVVVGSSADVVIIKEGVNDSFHLQSAAEVSTALQRLINVGRAAGKEVVIATLAPPTGHHASQRQFTQVYSESIRELAFLNSVPLADIEQVFVMGCADLGTCQYYNLPEGLHPNTVGYDAIAEEMASVLGG